MLTHEFSVPESSSGVREGDVEFRKPRATPLQTPSYLTEYYWWAYAHPLAVRVFERDWLINAILWGNYDRLRRHALDALGPDYSGRTLQVACVYGDFTHQLIDRIARGDGALDVVDALPVQIENLKRKLGPQRRTRPQLMDSASLEFADETFDRVTMFMLLHEMPSTWRRRTLAEAARTLKRGGRLVLMDYARPNALHPLRYLFQPVLWALEPFALDLWREPLETFYAGLPLKAEVPRRTFFGGLYQLVVLEKV